MANILVVDDELGIRDLLWEILNDEGHSVEVAENAAQARAARQRERPDLVLLDIWMPDTDGVTLLKEWSTTGLLTMPVIMMSGHATIDTAVAATKIGAQAFLEKPITLQKLPKAVEQGLVRSALTSWLRVTTGFVLAAIVAVPLGIYMATFPSVAAFFRPLSLTGAYVPIVVFIPLSLTWFGTGETQKVGFLFIGCFVALLPLVIKEISDVPASYLDVAVTKGASQWQLVRHVLFPVAQSSIWNHLRGVYGVGWGWIIMGRTRSRDTATTGSRWA